MYYNAWALEYSGIHKILRTENMTTITPCNVRFNIRTSVSMESFEEYLTKKKIDSDLFQSEREKLWREWKELFNQIHPNSFTAQKLFLINNIRRQFPAPIDKATSSKTSHSHQSGEGETKKD